ncbi:acetolactate synthase [Aspergillus ellipticus CBS 707.79]|uniref:Acetolactate synthase n=1 Tax=Aspergillus ellipticus CBS 707.79 TaxID=1448320 RepID=A0A319CSC0_9EURO|nr:acetolactate synthase [Aspergillus ellipticus CBS 707.79]
MRNCGPENISRQRYKRTHPRGLPQFTQDSITGMDRKNLLNRTGGDVLRELLLAHDVEHIFGYPGGAALPLFDGLFGKHKASSAFQFILAHHEQSAGHMAEGYARASQKPGVVLVTSGPGSSNTVTPMFDALLDGTPLVIICGQVGTAVQGTLAFQEIDVLALAQPCTKWSTCVQSIADLPGSIEAAFYHATTNRPGPTLVAIPKDIGKAIYDEPAMLHPSFDLSFSLPSPPSSGASSPTLMYNIATSYDHIAHIASLLNHAHRPIILAGQGLLNTPSGPALLSQISSLSTIPVTTTLLGIGSFDESLPTALHMLGTHGTPSANLAIQHADLILALGARLDERAVGNPTLFAPAARDPTTGLGIIHFDLSSPNTIGKVIPPTDLIEGDLCDTLPILLSHTTPNPRTTWLNKITTWKRTLPITPSTQSPPQNPQNTQPIHPHTLLTTLQAHLPSPTHQRTTLTTGVGQHQMHTARSITFPPFPASLITSGSLGTMGFGLPAAIGAKLVLPENLVINIDGDASFCMGVDALMTAAKTGVDVKVIICNNEGQGMIRQLQEMEYDGRECCSRQGNPDFVALAACMGVQGRRCLDGEELGSALEWLVQSRGVAVLEVACGEGMRPLVKTGGGLDEILW